MRFTMGLRHRGYLGKRRSTSSSEEPRPLMALFQLARRPELHPELDAGALRRAHRHTYTSRSLAAAFEANFECERSKQLVAKWRRSEGTLLIGINLGVASGCNHCLTHGTWDHAFEGAQRHH